MAKTTGAAVSTVYVREVPIDLHAQFKAYCARRGITIREGVMAAMRLQLQEARKK